MRTWLFITLIYAISILGIKAHAQVLDTSLITDYKEALGEAGRLWKKGLYQDALPYATKYYQLALKETSDSSHYVVGESLNLLALIYTQIGDYTRSKQLMHEGLNYTGKHIGKENGEFANRLYNLGFYYRQQGNLDSALQYFKRSEEIYRNCCKNEEGHIYSLNSLASIHFARGNYKKSIVSFQRVVEISEKELGTENENYMTATGSLGAVYNVLGNYEKALEYFTKAAEIGNRILGENHYSYGRQLSNIGVIHYSLQDYKKAKEYYEKSLEITAKSVGKKHVQYGQRLMSLGDAHLMLKNYDSSIYCFEESKNILDSTIGKNNTVYPSILNSLGIAHLRTESYHKAKTTLEEADKLLMERFGRRSFRTTKNALALGEVYLALEDLESASTCYNQANSSLITYIEQSFSFLTEFEKLEFIKKVQRYFQAYKVYVYNSKDLSAYNVLYNNELFYKGLVLESSARLKESLESAEDSSILILYYKLQDLKKSRSQQSISSKNLNKDSINKAIQKSESELIRKSPLYNEEVASTKVKWKDVQDNLGLKEVAIEFIRFKKNVYHKDYGMYYGALVVKPGYEHPKFVELCSDQDLKKVVNLSSSRKLDYIVQLYSSSSRGVSSEESETATLNQLLWHSLENEVKGSTTIYYAPSGLLHRLNLSALPIGEDSVLADVYKFREVLSTRAIALNKDVKSNSKIALFGGIKYDLSPNSDIDTTYIKPASRGSTSSAWKFLRATEKEVREIEDMAKDASLTVDVKSGYEGTEAFFKKLGSSKSSPQVIHLATHGYFLPTDLDKTESTAWPKNLVESTNPMVKSGIILAEGNISWKGDKLLSAEDGILTADEIAHLDLSGTELVVLSACETGLGEIQGDEGVFGLQRAFKQAGVKYIIMSLWQVPDYQTQDLMVTFYKKWLEDKMQIPDAFHAAQLEMKNRYRNPYFWAGFKLLN